MLYESTLVVTFFALLNEERVIIPAVRTAAAHVNLKKCFIVFFFRVINLNNNKYGLIELYTFLIHPAIKAKAYRHDGYLKH